MSSCPPALERSGVQQRRLARAGGSRVLGYVSVALGVLGCGAEAETPALAQRQQDIYRGSVDTTHLAVMYLFNQAGLACSGTNLRSNDGQGFLLTAAHCVTSLTAVGPVAVTPQGLLVVPGSDVSLSSVAYGVQQVHVPETFAGVFGSDDIAIVRFFFGSDPAPASIEALPLADDDLAVGDPFVLVGFGRTETTAENTQRRQVQRFVNGIDSQLVLYSQADGRGSCSGDSGGPGLIQRGGAERVAVVISGGVDFSGDPCSGGFGFGTRVSAYEAFIRGVLDTFEQCESCTARAATICETGLAACNADGSCSAYLACDQLCIDEDCRVSCVIEHPEGYVALRNFTECVCGACSACAETPGCERPACGFAEPEALCPCVSDNCCTIAADCQADAVCEACVSLPGFELGCAESVLLQELGACLSTCEAACSAP